MGPNSASCLQRCNFPFLSVSLLFHSSNKQLWSNLNFNQSQRSSWQPPRTAQGPDIAAESVTWSRALKVHETIISWRRKPGQLKEIHTNMLSLRANPVQNLSNGIWGQRAVCFITITLPNNSFLGHKVLWGLCRFPHSEFLFSGLYVIKHGIKY